MPGVPDKRTHRGRHPSDDASFAPDQLERLRAAVDELSWLLDRGYSARAALQLVGDRHSLRLRQRKAVQRVAAGNDQVARRRATRVVRSALRDEPLLIDGYNVLLTVEAALSGGVLLLSRDGTLRDLTAMSGHYRRVATTREALARLGAFCHRTASTRWCWLFDRPISNSGRLKLLVASLAEERAWPWEVELVPSPDRVLATTDGLIATADSAVLDRCSRWFNLARSVVESEVPEAEMLDLTRAPCRPAQSTIR